MKLHAIWWILSITSSLLLISCEANQNSLIENPATSFSSEELSQVITTTIYFDRKEESAPLKVGETTFENEGQGLQKIISHLEKIRNLEADSVKGISSLMVSQNWSYRSASNTLESTTTHTAFNSEEIPKAPATDIAGTTWIWHFTVEPGKTTLGLQAADQFLKDVRPDLLGMMTSGQVTGYASDDLKTQYGNKELLTQIHSVDTVYTENVHTGEMVPTVWETEVLPQDIGAFQLSMELTVDENQLVQTKVLAFAPMVTKRDGFTGEFRGYKPIAWFKGK